MVALNKVRTITISLIVGIPLAIFTMMLALGLAGGGHGWITPFWVSIVGLIGFPVGIYSLVTKEGVEPGFTGVALTVAALCDLAVLFLTFNEGTEYFGRTFPYNLLWVAFWASWQFALLVGVTRSRREAETE